jgi:hypothetical protein
LRTPRPGSRTSGDGDNLLVRIDRIHRRGIDVVSRVIIGVRGIWVGQRSRVGGGERGGGLRGMMRRERLRRQAGPRESDWLLCSPAVVRRRGPSRRYPTRADPTHLAARRPRHRDWGWR